MSETSDVAEPETIAELAALLRQLRRREARRTGGAQLTYREIAAKTGWSHGIVGEYFAGRVLPPTDRFDELIRLLGADQAEQGRLATARDRVEERRRGGAPARVEPACTAVRQLPPSVHGFIGRDAELAELDRLTEADSGAPVLITALSGTAGVGKTALALHWAHRTAHRFPDGQLYLNLRGFDPTGPAVAPGDALRALLDTLGVPAHRIPASSDRRSAVYRELLFDRRTLVVLDNARDAAQVRPLLVGGSACRTLVTSRNQLTGLVATEGAQPVVLDLLTEAEARDLLVARIGADRVAAEPAAVAEIIAACARLPLALAIVAARAAMHPTFPLTALAAELAAAPGRQAAFAAADLTTDTRTVFSWSYRTLAPGPARLFRLLALHPGPDLAAPAVASLLGQPLTLVRPSVTELTVANLLAEHTPGRYAFHDLLREYAGHLTRATDSGTDRSAARERLLSHYLRTAHHADLRLDPHRDPVPLPPNTPGVTVSGPADHGAALAWFDTELPVLQGMLAAAEAAGADLHLCRLTRTLAHYLERRGRWQLWIAVQEQALAAARRLADPVEEAHARRSMGRACMHLDRLGAAGGHFGAALVLFRTAADDCGQARIHMDLTWMAYRQGRWEKALHHGRQALDLFTRAGQRSGRGRALNNIGWSLIGLGRPDEALAHLRRALRLLERLDDRFGAADSWDSVGQAQYDLGQYHPAVAAYRRAHELWQELGHRFSEADVLRRLGDTQRAMGDPDAARDSWRRAWDILRDLEHPDAAEVAARLAALDQEPARPGAQPEAGDRGSDHRR
ncbi:tetratricopeptide repeat protein [Jidongwangia harbinensis]|uniref:tetratricopeptide repeat protein n=1 Tax=Jidongwangia harbinensis TaxID=2878561 RepID=UPI001CD96A67|nr:tetratricopeptide repeat protein [Jidongwangia harbinensis]MCA2216522.1 tetratricopeptide repeat protein [Jidongwangia harbinensis]